MYDARGHSLPRRLREGSTPDRRLGTWQDDGDPGGRFMYNRQYIPLGRKRQEPPAGAQKNCKICKKGLHFPEKSHILFYETKTEYEKGVV